MIDEAGIDTYQPREGPETVQHMRFGRDDVHHRIDTYQPREGPETRQC